MINLITKYSKSVVAFALVSITFMSCTEEDTYKEFIKDGEISYTGKIDSLKIYSGRDRVKVEGLFTSDTKITECRIFWNLGKDSVSVPVTRNNVVDTLRTYINNLGDNIYSFNVHTYDALGNKSIPVSAIGQSFGDRYQNVLNNRPIVSKTLSQDSELTINLGNMDTTSGVFGCDFTYTDATSDEEKTVFVPIDSSRVVLPNFKIVDNNLNFKYKSLYIPKEEAIDTFSTAYFTYKVPVLKNNSIPFSNDASGSSGKFFNLKDWTTNDAVKNIDGFGGIEYYQSREYYLGMRSGYTGDEITNGKIHQTVSALSGRYVLNTRVYRTNISDSDEGGFYIVVAKGNTLPDFDDLTTNENVLSMVQVSGANTFKAKFNLEEDTDITIGFVATLGRKYIVIESVDIDQN